MKFVTKQEYRAAVETIRRAIENKQLKCTFHDTMADEMMFGAGKEIYPEKQVAFIAAPDAAKEKLLSLRNLLNKKRQEKDKNEKDIEALELEEKRLSTLIPTIKE